MFLFFSNVPHAREQASSNNELKLEEADSASKVTSTHTLTLWCEGIWKKYSHMDCLGAGIRTAQETLLSATFFFFFVVAQKTFNPVCEKRQKLACFCGCCEDETLSVYKGLGFS